MKNELEIQRRYWNNEAESFEKIYTHEKSAFANFMDRVFRIDIYRRFQATVDGCAPYEGRRFLDIGCGNGWFSIEIARRGAAKVTGIDIAENMIALSRKNAEAAGIADRCDFVQLNLSDYHADARADVCFAMGVFDYIREPLPVLAEMHQAATDIAFIAFPRLWTWRAPIRKLRLFLRGCPVYFYTRRRIARLMDEAGFHHSEIISMGKIFFVTGHIRQEPE